MSQINQTAEQGKAIVAPATPVVKNAPKKAKSPKPAPVKETKTTDPAAASKVGKFYVIANKTASIIAEDAVELLNLKGAAGHILRCLLRDYPDVFKAAKGKAVNIKDLPKTSSSKAAPDEALLKLLTPIQRGNESILKAAKALKASAKTAGKVSIDAGAENKEKLVKSLLSQYSSKKLDAKLSAKIVNAVVVELLKK
jgi:hypothetical protein